MQDKIEQCLKDVLPFLELKKGSIDGCLKHVRLYGQEYSITKWDDKQYKKSLDKVVDFFLKNHPELVRGRFADTIAKILIHSADKSVISKEVRDLIESLTSIVKARTVCIPIQGIDLRMEKVRFEFATLYRSDSGILSSIIEDGRSLYGYQHGINALESCKCYLQIEINSDHEKAKNTALIYSNHLASILNLFIGSSLYRSNYRSELWNERVREAETGRKRKIGVWGAESGKDQVYYEFFTNDDPYREAEYSLEFKFIEAGHDTHELINEFTEFLRPNQAKASYHLFNEELERLIFCKENQQIINCVKQRNNIDKKLYQSVNWFGKAVNSDSLEDQFLFFAISLECLLVGDEASGIYSSQGSINQKISERAAFLAANDVNSRIKTEKELKELYGIRSKIVHAGKNATKQDVIRIEKIARNLIFQFSKKNFISSKDFLKWVKTCQYG